MPFRNPFSTVVFSSSSTSCSLLIVRRDKKRSRSKPTSCRDIIIVLLCSNFILLHQFLGLWCRKNNTKNEKCSEFKQSHTKFLRDVTTIRNAQHSTVHWMMIKFRVNLRQSQSMRIQIKQNVTLWSRKKTVDLEKRKRKGRKRVIKTQLGHVF